MTLTERLTETESFIQKEARRGEQGESGAGSREGEREKCKDRRRRREVLYKRYN